MLRILIAHSDEKLTGIYQRRLTGSLQVDSAHDGLAAYRQMKRAHPNIILSDYALPKLSGTSLLKFVRSHPEMLAIPFLFFTKRELSEPAMGLGANDWIHLPSTPPILVIEKIFYHLKLTDQLTLAHV